MSTNVLTKNIHYHSYGMLHPDGTLMTRCSRRKADWYISRGLATWVDHEYFKLVFVPNGYGKHADPFYTEKLENKCVVCGSTENLTKHHVVPFQFRRILPVQYKSRNHHDVLLLCWECHESYERKADILKDTLLNAMGFDFKRENAIQKHNRHIETARAILADFEKGTLKCGRDGVKAKIPENRLIKLKETASQDLIENYDSWQDVFLKTYDNDDKLYDFFCLWRQHFVEYAQPKFLPTYWQINHKVEKSHSD
jgi:exonuclease 3'-5' domain-containing protein 2